MTGLSVASQTALKAMIQAAPDDALVKLSRALRTTPGERVDWIRRMIMGEQAVRRMRQAAFGPLVPMFRARMDGVRALTFPAPVLGGLWRQVCARQPALVDQAREMTVGGGEIDAGLLDQFCVSAAAVLRDDPASVWSPLKPDVAEELAACFDLAPLARAALPMLGRWTGPPDPDSEASLRLMMRDAERIGENAAVRMTEILLANIAEAPLILRVIGRVANTDGEERFLAESELADFGERLFERLEVAAEALDEFHPARAAPGDAEAVAARLTAAAEILRQMELSLALTPDGDWGARFQALKMRMSRGLDNVMGLAPRMVDKALPLERVRIVGAMSRMAPVMDAAAHGPLMDQARSALVVLHGARSASAVLGCGGQRAQICDTLQKRLMPYGDELIEGLNAGDVKDEAHVAVLAELCAGFLELCDAAPAAKALRRRLAATGATAAPSPRVA
ncbi:MAG: hypothetical protein ACI8U3_000361 [Brevundimonas sp.]|jgi:hypothetical protein|uniref:hypothetical protein n=1 Tax=Brevundimonas sp. TaxID=1871086 RepID=UPI0039E3C88B